MDQKDSKQNSKLVVPKRPSIFGILKDYKLLILALFICAVGVNGLNLVLPKIIAAGIDTFTAGHFNINYILWEFFWYSLAVLVFTYLQALVQTFASERVARDMRATLSAKISRQSYLFVQNKGGATLLTNLTSDIDAVKLFISQSIVAIISSGMLIIGAAILLILINWKLGLVVLTIIPLIGASFFLIFSKMGTIFKRRQEMIDWLNKVINESILGAALIRVLNSQVPEYRKFLEANDNAQSVGLSIVYLFASLIPIITIIANLATVAVLVLGGHYVIGGTMSLGNFTAFNNYIAMLIFPIIIIGFTSNSIASAVASFGRVNDVLDTVERPETGKMQAALRGDIRLEDVSLSVAGAGERPILKHISFEIKAGTKTAIIGPTAAGKTQLLYLLTGLTVPDSGVIDYDGRPLDSYDKTSLVSQIGFVFQDSIIFNLSLRENIAFSNTVKDADLEKAIKTAELRDFIDGLPQGLDTIVSERGASLSGGQKQRIMLARALALNPKILLLDDFTARVDGQTEARILENIAANYKGVTLLSVTQKIAAVEKYDQIIVLEQGELVAQGRHEELLKTSPEYVQIFNSQRSTSAYEEQK